MLGWVHVSCLDLSYDASSSRFFFFFFFFYFDGPVSEIYSRLIKSNWCQLEVCCLSNLEISHLSSQLLDHVWGASYPLCDLPKSSCKWDILPLIVVTMSTSFFIVTFSKKLHVGYWPFGRWNLHSLFSGRSRGNFKCSELGWCIFDLISMVEWRCNR